MSAASLAAERRRDTFTGIRPADVAAFAGAQLFGAVTAIALDRFLVAPPDAREIARDRQRPSAA